FLIRQLLVRGLIVPLRFRQSAKSYQEIWLSQGSPLMVYSRQAKELLQKTLDQENSEKEYFVELAMRYQNPSIKKGLNELLGKKIEHLIVIPLFPQYASATTGSIHEYILKLLAKEEVIPKVSLIDHFANDPLYIAAVAATAHEYPLKNYDHFLFSFHGLPKSHLIKANPNCMQNNICCETSSCYLKQCKLTADEIAKKLGMDISQYSVSFQSRLGKEPWLEPFTVDRIKELVKENKKRVLVFCPSFVADCLETIYEIGIEYKHEFIQAGGEKLDFVRSLNDHPKWIDALKGMVESHVYSQDLINQL
ncbi:MAG TPA: ferrochelatase, partial [Parachlamydiaceae bacterium]|nr:ferrochelatase [Parachlamydiaceae bacterium]